MKDWTITVFLSIFSFIILNSCTSRSNNTGDANTEENSQTSPNIVLIFADDMGYGDVGSFGAEYIHTPHLDQMAQEGIRLTDFYATPNCSPSRAALLTGSYPQRVGIPWVVGPAGPSWTAGKSDVGLNPEEETIAELLKEKGYATACIGKWHLGHYKQHLPVHHGFDEFYGLPYSNDMWPATDPVYAPLTLLEGENPVDTIATLEDQAKLTGLYTERAVEFISSNKNNPFFLYFAHSMPHVPINASEQFQGNSEKGLYGDVIQEIDWSVGKVLQTLDSLGLEENTLVVFTTDNGPWLVYGNHAGSAEPFREGKHTTFEGGVRVPFIARWPGKIAANTESDAIAGLIDLLPTISEIAGVSRPDLPIDGQSLWPLLSGGDSSAREVHYFFHTHELQAVRKGQWKLHLPHQYQTVTEPGSDGERGETVNQQLERSLFDLEADPGEENNVASQHPAIVEELQKLAQDFAEEMENNKRKAAKSTQTAG